MDALLPMIVSGLIDRAHFALAPNLADTFGDPGRDAENEERFLRLSASAGSSQVDGRLWNGLDGEFARIRIGKLKIGHIAQSGEPLTLNEHEIQHSHWDPLTLIGWHAKE